MTAASTILIVDDNPPSRVATASILSQAGFVVSQACNGAAALPQIRALRPALVLLEVRLPGLSGLEVLRQIRADPGLTGVSVVLLSSFQLSQYPQASGLDAGADGYIARPVADAELLAGVRAHLRQRELTEQLRSSELQFSSAFEFAAIGMALVAPDGRFLKVNRAVCEMLGYPVEELLALTFQDITHREDLEADLAQVRRLLDGTIESYRLEKRYLHRQGRQVWVLLSVSLVRDEAGQPFHFISQLQDVTEQKLAETELRRTNDLLRAVADGTPDAVFVKDLNGRYLLCNKAAARFFGLTVDEMLRQDDIAIFGLDRGRAVMESDRRVMETGLVQTTEEAMTVTGVTRIFHAFKAPYRDASGNVVGIISIARDITEPKLAEQRLARSNRLYQMLSKINETIVRVTSPQSLFEGMCLIAVEQGEFRMAAVVQMDADTGRIRPLAHAGAENGYFAEISTDFSLPELNRSTIGTAIGTGLHDVCNNFANDPRMAPWKTSALRRGYRSAASFPIKVEGRIFGALVLYAAEIDYFQADEIDLLVAVGDELSYAIEYLRKEQQRQRAETALRASEANLAAAQRIAHFGSWELDVIHQDDFDANPLRWSDEMFRIAGFEPGEVEVTNSLFFQLVHPEDREPIRQAVAAAIRERRNYSITHRLIRPDGGERIVSETAQIIFGEHDGPPVKFVGTAEDITERRHAEEKLREQATLLDKAQDAIMVRGLDHCVLYWNLSAERLYGWTAPEALGRNIPELLHRDPAGFLAATATALAKGEWVGEIEETTKDGKHLTVEGRWTLLRDEQGNPKSILSINTDITARKKLELQFLRAQRMESIGTLAGGIAHDLNNVLSPIIMSLDLLKIYVREPKALDILAMIGSSARRGADMVNQVLSFARGMESERVTVRMDQLIREVVKIAEDTFPKNIRIEALVHRDLWTIEADSTQLHQVLINLCVNARDAMPHGGRITIRATNTVIDEQLAALELEARAGSYLRLDVEDTGGGIPAEVVDKVFDPFFTTKEVGKGTGLGLSTTLAIVKGHGGFVRLDSEPGSGTRFHVYFPATPGSAPTSDRLPEAHLPHGSGETVLVVDDEAAIRQVIRHTLEAFSYRVLLAADGAEAVSIYTERGAGIDVVLTDMMMPVMDGPALAKALRQLDPDVRIIGASGLSNGKGSQSTEAGVHHFLPKPYTAETLLKTLRLILSGG